MKKKKIIAAIIALVVVFVVALGVESSFSKEKIDFVGEAENIEYYFEKMYLLQRKHGVCNIESVHSRIRSFTN